MKRFIVPSFIVVICLHAAIVFSIINLNPVTGFEKKLGLESKKKQSLSIWDIYQQKAQKIEPAVKAKVVPEMVIQKPIVKSIKVPAKLPEPSVVAKKSIPSVKLKRVENRVSRTYQPRSLPSALKVIRTAKSALEPRSRVSRKLLVQEYQLKLLKLIASRLEYPAFAKRMAYEGIVKVKLEVLGSGDFSLIQVYLSSNYKSLDEDAVELIKSLSSIIKNKLNQKMRMIIPVEYNLLDRN